MRILITGSRNWSDESVIENAILDLNNWYPLDWDETVIVHGAAPGADALARRFAVKADLTQDPHPADWGRYGKAAGPKRNQEMVDLGADVVLSFMEPESKGTRHCTAQALKAGLPVKIILKVEDSKDPEKWTYEHYSFNGAMPADKTLTEEQTKELLHPYYN